jgi:hypothetical protein
MRVYHGSNVIVERPNLEWSKRTLDFGPGFYTTTNKEQAVNFARKVMIRKELKSQAVSVYDYDAMAAETELNILRFAVPDRAWLDFVSGNRHGTYKDEPYDLVIGPVANDDVFAVLIVYEQGILTIDQTLAALRIKKLFDQYVFKTARALSFLNYTGSFDPREQ